LQFAIWRYIGRTLYIKLRLISNLQSFCCFGLESFSLVNFQIWRVSVAIHLSYLNGLSRDGLLLFATCGVRLFAYGCLSVILGLILMRLD